MLSACSRRTADKSTRILPLERDDLAVHVVRIQAVNCHRQLARVRNASRAA